MITRANGGNVFVTRSVEQNAFPSTDRNGVKSSAWSAGSVAFRVAASSTALIATATNAPAPVVGTTTPTPAAIVTQPIATPIVMTTICSPGQTKPGNAPTSVSANTDYFSPVGGDLTWTAPTDAAGYVVERALASGGTPAKIATTCENSESFFVVAKDATKTIMGFRDRTGGIQPKTTYIYVVRAFGGGGEMGWNSTRWTSQAVPVPEIIPVSATNVVNGSTLTLKWNIRSVDQTTLKSTREPDDFLVTSDYGYSQVVPRGSIIRSCGCTHTILGVPLGTHTFTVEARWSPDAKTSRSMPFTFAPTSG